MRSGPLMLLAVLTAAKTGCPQQLDPSQKNIAHAGGSATFICSGTRSDDPPVNITWVFTNSDLMNNRSNVIEQFDSNIQIGRLTISQLLLSYNDSLVSCSVLLTSGIMDTSPQSRLLILEIYNLTVIKQQDETIALNWNTSLSMLSDVSYCVDVINTTPSRQLVSICNITTTEYIYTYLEPSRINCTSIEFIVTPVIKGAGNGTEISASFEPQVFTPQFVNVSEPTYSGDLVTYIFQMSATVCHAEVIITDSSTDNAIQLDSDSVTISGANITVTTQLLMMNRYYDVTITAYNFAGERKSDILLRKPITMTVALLISSQHI